MKTTPKLSIVCITYNQEQYIRQTLDGFVSQVVDFPLEIIISDDCSSDNTPEIIAEYANKYPALFKPNLRKKNLGAIANSIASLKAATGEYIALCEGDDYWTDPNKLQTQVDFLASHKEFGGCFHVVEVVYSDTADKSYLFPDVPDPAWYTTEELLRTNYVPTNSVVYRRRNYDALPANVMPFDWFLHLYHSQDGPLAFLDKKMSVYRKHQAGLWWDYDKNRDQIWKKFGLAYMALYTEMSKLFTKDQKKQAIIDESINVLLSTLIDIDQKFSESLLEQAMAAYPKRAQPFMVYERQQVVTLTERVEQLTKELLQVGDERSELVIELDKATTAYNEVAKELHAVVGTRIWRTKTKFVDAKQKLRGTRKSQR
ncbi:MAG: putative sugar transferase [Candidatus Saccharibacteria bacterium]|nr:putative sugar transferase [Candidatus Saccharibacteria bacterium]